MENCYHIPEICLFLILVNWEFLCVNQPTQYEITNGHIRAFGIRNMESEPFSFYNIFPHYLRAFSQPQPSALNSVKNNELRRACSPQKKARKLVIVKATPMVAFPHCASSENSNWIMIVFRSVN